jgi:hypothetical protein
MFTQYTVLALNQAATAESTQQGFDKAAAAGLDFKATRELLARQAGDDDASKKEYYRAFVAMESILRQDESAVAEAEAAIRQGDAVAGTLIDALGHAGSAAAQKSLAGLANDSGTPGFTRFQSLRALSFGARPTDDNVAAHKALFEDPGLGAQAHFGLGSLIHQMLEAGEPDRASEALAALIDDLQSATDPREKVLILRALGNAGHPATIAVIQPLLRDGDALVRAEALLALRRISGEDVDAMIAWQIQHDPEVRVRGTALQLLGERPTTPILLETLTNVTQLEPHDSLRLAAVGIFASGYGPPEVAKTVLQWVVANEPADAVRASAEEALQRLL